MSTPAIAGQSRLIDAYDPLLGLVFQLQQTPDPGQADALRSKLNEMLQASSAKARAMGASEETVNEARYALVALLDEVVLSSSWPLKDTWLGRPLQMEHFNSFAAGEQFFSLLETVRKGNDPRKAETLEIFLTCLCLGFRGKHVGVSGMEVLRGLQRSLLEELAQAAAAAPQQTDGRRKTDPTELAPSWRPPNEPMFGALPKEISVRLVMVLCLVLLLVLYLSLNGALRLSASAITGS